MQLRKLNILFLDWQISHNEIGNALSCKLNSSIFNLNKILIEQIRYNDSLGKETRKVLESGKMLSTELIGRFIKRNLKATDKNLLFIEYPKTIKQFDGLKKILKDENIRLESIWYFQHREPNEFMNDYFKKQFRKIWIDEDELIQKWKTNFTKKREQIAEIQSEVKNLKWKIIEVDYDDISTQEHIKRKIKDCA